jgi:hypothetical protein
VGLHRLDILCIRHLGSDESHAAVHFGLDGAVDDAEMEVSSVVGWLIDSLLATAVLRCTDPNMVLR